MNSQYSIGCKILPFLILTLGLFCSSTHAQAQPDSSLIPLGLTNGQFHFLLNAETNQDYVIDASTNLVDWVPVLEQAQAPGPMEIIDPFAGSFQIQFYRARKISLSALKPAEVDVFAGDSLLFLIEAFCRASKRTRFAPCCPVAS